MEQHSPTSSTGEGVGLTSFRRHRMHSLNDTPPLMPYRTRSSSGSTPLYSVSPHFVEHSTSLHRLGHSISRPRADTPQLPSIVPEDILKLSGSGDSEPSFRAKLFGRFHLEKPALGRRNLFIVYFIGLFVYLCLSIGFFALSLVTEHAAYFLILYSPALITVVIIAVIMVLALKRGTEVKRWYLTTVGSVGIFHCFIYLHFIRNEVVSKCQSPPWYPDAPPSAIPIPSCDYLSTGGRLVVSGLLMCGIMVRSMGSLRLVERDDNRDTEAESGDAYAILDSDLEAKMRGRVYTQLTLVYLAFLAFIAIAANGGWAPEILPNYTYLLAYICFLVLEFQRSYKKKDSPLPLFINLIPAIWISATTCSIHSIASVTFFFSTIIIQLQLLGLMEKSAHQKLLRFCRVYTLLYALIGYPFAIIVMFLSTFIPTLAVCRPPFGANIVWAEHVLIIAVIVLGGIGFSELNLVVWQSLRQRLKAVKILSAKTEELTVEVDRLKSAFGDDRQLDAPIKCATDGIRNLIQTVKSPKLQRSLMMILHSLSRQNVYEIDPRNVNQQVVDLLPQELVDELGSHGSGFRKPSTSSSELGRPFTRSQSVGSASSTIITTTDVIFDWNYDIVQNATSEMLVKVACAVMKKHKLISSINEAKFQTFVRLIDARYQDNPYHNSLHASDVTLALSHFLDHGLSDKLGTIEKLAVIVAGIIHDVDHPGHNNNFESAIGSQLAIMFSDVSILEHHHLHVAFALLAHDSANFIDLFEKRQQMKFRKLVIGMVLATDMAEHFSFMGHFSTALSTDCEWKSPNEIALLVNMAIKCADISNPVKKVDIAVEWSIRVLHEFWNQGESQRAHCLEISRFFDKNKHDVCKCQLGFIDYVVSPLFKAWSDLFPDYVPYLENLGKTRDFWSALTEDEAFEKVSSTWEHEPETVLFDEDQEGFVSEFMI